MDNGVKLKQGMDKDITSRSYVSTDNEKIAPPNNENY
jgi:hypothetical protein